MAPIVIFWLTPCTLCRILIINQICVFLPKVSVFWRDLIFIILTHKLSLQNILYVVLDFVQILFWTFLVNISNFYECQQRQSAFLQNRSALSDDIS